MTIKTSSETFRLANPVRRRHRRIHITKRFREDGTSFTKPSYGQRVTKFRQNKIKSKAPNRPRGGVPPAHRRRKRSKR